MKERDRHREKVRERERERERKGEGARNVYRKGPLAKMSISHPDTPFKFDRKTTIKS